MLNATSWCIRLSKASCKNFGWPNFYRAHVYLIHIAFNSIQNSNYCVPYIWYQYISNLEYVWREDFCTNAGFEYASFGIRLILMIPLRPLFARKRLRWNIHPNFHITVLGMYILICGFDFILPQDGYNMFVSYYE